MSKNGRQSRTVKWGDWESFQKLTGLKKKKNGAPASNTQKKTKQKEKFAKCKECGGQMTYIPNTNVLVCENEVENTRITDGVKTTHKCRCGNINLVDNKYLDYVKYLFS